jgi:hypothetical protein
MQQQTNEAFRADAFVSQADFDAAQATPAAKPNRATRRASAAKAKPSKPAAKPEAAKPTTAERDAQRAAASDDLRLARAIAGQAVGEFYPGASKPFKAASDAFADINEANAKPGPTGIGTMRQAALHLALATYGSTAFKPDGSFVRGGFRVPAHLINPKLPRDTVIAAQPESGCLGNTLGLTVEYVSGPRSGKAQREAIYRVRVATAAKLIAATFGDKQRLAYLTLLANAGVRDAVKLAKAA